MKITTAVLLVLLAVVSVMGYDQYKIAAPPPTPKAPSVPPRLTYRYGDGTFETYVMFDGDWGMYRRAVLAQQAEQAQQRLLEKTLAILKSESR